MRNKIIFISFIVFLVLIIGFTFFYITTQNKVEEDIYISELLVVKDDTEYEIKISQETGYIYYRQDNQEEIIYKFKTKGKARLGIPNLEEIELAEPEIAKRGREYCVKIGAKSYSYHMQKIALSSFVTPLVGSKKQCEDFLEFLKQEKEKGTLGEVNIFGKNLTELVSLEMAEKMGTMPTSIQQKMTKTITHIVNEGKGGILCILL